MGRAFISVRTGGEWISSESLLARALIAALQIGADGIFATGIAKTLVYVWNNLSL